MKYNVIITTDIHRERYSIDLITDDNEYVFFVSAQKKISYNKNGMTFIKHQKRYKDNSSCWKCLYSFIIDRNIFKEKASIYKIRLLRNQFTKIPLIVKNLIESIMIEIFLSIYEMNDFVTEYFDEKGNYKDV